MSQSIKYIILGRMSYTRLPGKMLLKLNGKPLLWYSVNAIIEHAGAENCIVATSELDSDTPLYEYAKSLGITCIRGSLNNVAQRFADAVTLSKADYCIRVCGDNVFVNHDLLKQFDAEIQKNEFDFISNTLERSYPYGMSLEAVRSSVYLNSIKNFDNDKGDLEHVMPYLYRTELIKKHFIYNRKFPEGKGLQLAIDTKEDFNKVDNILKQLDKPYFDLSIGEIKQYFDKVK